EGGAREVATSTPGVDILPTPSAQPSIAQSAATATGLPTPDSTDTLTIGLLGADQPYDLLPYHTNDSDARNSAPLTALLFPPPLLSVGYSYTTTGVLLDVPTMENGGVALQK